MGKLTVRDLFDLKGERQLVAVYCATPAEAAACEEAGVDTIVTGLGGVPAEIRTAAPNTFLTLGAAPGELPEVMATPSDAVRVGLEAMEMGADAVYTGAGFASVEAMADEAIPVVGHVGFIPYRSSWWGGPRAVGKTAAEAAELYRRTVRYQDAGAIAVEMEIVPSPVATEICRRVDVIVLSMGAGAGCDGQYLFACDILGTTVGHVPRHARTYRNLAAQYAEIHAESVGAFREFIDDVTSGTYPAPGEMIEMGGGELAAFEQSLNDAPSPSQHPRMRQVGHQHE